MSLNPDHLFSRIHPFRAAKIDSAAGEDGYEGVKP